MICEVTYEVYLTAGGDVGPQRNNTLRRTRLDVAAEL